ncbi:phosphoenolpyruvate--protein phosphotransferase [Acholeplasma granularum]|uniref:phosphoenolpyruvate--protein phosphotransferase n=1 Tax=Acholeplasma granularum TaxID=264635 RepID=UPI0004727149|nr:phosphoenolpyruvate--protein phosphotransferase [Acholeplasma granularum]
MKKIKGIPVSSGIAIAKIHHLNETLNVSSSRYATNKDYELLRLTEAIKDANFELEGLVEQASQRIGTEHAQIFSAQQAMLNDPEVFNNAKTKIMDFNLEASFAFKQTMSEMIDLFELSNNPYIQARIPDLKDIIKRMLRILNDDVLTTEIFTEDIILTADDLLPSQTLHLDTKHIKGILIEVGSKTSHSAILARNLGIPAITGITVSELTDGTIAIIDGENGTLILSPDDQTIEVYKEKLETEKKKKNIYKQTKDEVATTKDGTVIHVAANVGLKEDVEAAMYFSSEGIGLLRTENQYMHSKTFPTENELKEFYLYSSEKFNKHEVVIRTLDIGGDKNLSYLNMRKELNPFLGNRAIRYSLSYPSLLETQLRAILKANIHNNIKIMFPMISNLEELLEAKRILNVTIDKLKNEGIEVFMPKIGIMVEVPSTAFGIEKFLPHLDFISIGTNDLIQYLFAADRMNDKVVHLYQPYHPILLKTLKYIVDKANEFGIIVSVCGEMASHKAQSLLLIGLGIRNLSMHANLIPEIKYIIRKSSLDILETIIETSLMLDHNSQVEALILNYLKELNL